MRKRKDDGTGFVSRSAYKLVQLAEKYPLFRSGRVVVDLGAAPGGWCQAVQKVSPESPLFALDLLPLEISISKGQYMQGDFTDESVRETLRELVSSQLGSSQNGAYVDIVLSDMMGTHFC